MKKYLFYLLLLVIIYFLWSPILGVFFPEYSYSIVEGVGSSQAIADYLKDNYKAEDFGITTAGKDMEWKLNILRERDPFLKDLNFIFKKQLPPKRNRHLYVKVNYREVGSETWEGTKIAKKKLVLNVDETNENKIMVTETK